MKQIRILHNRLLLISILLLLIQISGTCQEHNDDLKMPVYTIEGKEYTLKDSCIEKTLSSYIETKFPILIYDTSYFRFLVSIKIGKKGIVKRVKLLNKRYWKDCAREWNKVKNIIYSLNVKPATKNGQPIDYKVICYVILDFR